MKGKGFTLIEVVVVVAILAILSVVGIESIVEFQKNAVLEGTANEFASTLREARTKSISGELLSGETPDDFTNGGLPKYGVKIDATNYVLFREYQNAAGVKKEDLETFLIGDKLTLTPSPGEIIFSRITGVGTGNMTFSLKRNDNGKTIEIGVGDKGVTLAKL